MVRLLPTILAVTAFASLAGAVQAADLDYGYGPPRVYGRPVYERPVVVERPIVVERPVVVEERPVYAPRPYGYRPWYAIPSTRAGPSSPIGVLPTARGPTATELSSTHRSGAPDVGLMDTDSGYSLTRAGK